MSTFTDQVFLQFLQDTFVEDLLKNQLGLLSLFNLTYTVETIELKEILLAGIQNRQFQMPIFETIRTIGTDERITPSSERLQLNRSQPRYGRLEWIEIFLGIILSTKVQDKGAQIESINVKNLIEELGGIVSIAELRTKLKLRYSDSIVDAFFKEMRISSIEEFKKKNNSLLEFIYKTPPLFDPNDPQNNRTFPLDICIKIQSDLNLSEAIKSAKLCRNILENEKDFRQFFDGGEIKNSYAFVVIFPNSLVVDNAIPGLTAAQIKASIKSLFAVEDMLVYFFV